MRFLLLLLLSASVWVAPVLNGDFSGGLTGWTLDGSGSVTTVPVLPGNAALLDTEVAFSSTRPPPTWGLALLPLPVSIGSPVA